MPKGKLKDQLKKKTRMSEGSQSSGTASRERGGVERRPAGTNPPARQEEYAPPMQRATNLDEEQKKVAKGMFDRIAGEIDLEVPNLIIHLAYQSMVDTPQADNLNALKDRVLMLMSEQSTFDLRTKCPNDPFANQVTHMLQLCGLPLYRMPWIIGSVIFDDSDHNIANIQKMVFACRYQGFDPSVILKKIIRSWMDNRRVERRAYTLRVEQDGQEVDWIYSNKEPLIEDVTFLLLIFLNRGAVIEKISKRSARDFTTVIRMLVAKYNIRANEEGGRRRRAEALGPEVVTLPRISACFAQLTTTLFHHGYGRVIISTNDFPNCPQALFSPMLSSVVRKGYLANGVMVNIHPQLILVAILVDNVLHIRDRPTSLDLIWTYYLAAHNSGVLLDEARIEQCNDLDITINGEFSPLITGLRQNCIERIRQLRPHDRLEDIINEMNRLP